MLEVDLFDFRHVVFEIILRNLTVSLKLINLLGRAFIAR